MFKHKNAPPNLLGGAFLKGLNFKLSYFAIPPIDTEQVAIKGGNHSQFGDYGFQKGDNEAEIAGEKQRELVVLETMGFIEEIIDEN